MFRRTCARLATSLSIVLLCLTSSPPARAADLGAAASDSSAAAEQDTTSAPADTAAATPAAPADTTAATHAAPPDTTGAQPAVPSWQLAPGFVVPPADSAAAADTAAAPETFPPEPVPRGRPRVGLVLSGGGARGAAHIGLLQVLEEHRVAVDYIAGASMGALIGGLYAAGMSPAALDSVVRGMDWREAFTDGGIHRRPSFTGKRDDDLLLSREAGVIFLNCQEWRTGFAGVNTLRLNCRRTS